MKNTFGADSQLGSHARFGSADQPRDDHGRWSSGPGGEGHALAVKSGFYHGVVKGDRAKVIKALDTHASALQKSGNKSGVSAVEKARDSLKTNGFLEARSGSAAAHVLNALDTHGHGRLANNIRKTAIQDKISDDDLKGR